MSLSKQPNQIKKQVTGKLLTVIIEKKKYTMTLSDDKTKNLILTEIELYNKKNSEARVAKLIKLLQPITEKKKTDLIVAKKQRKVAIKKLTKELKAVDKDLKASGKSNKNISKIDPELSELVKSDKRFVVKDGNLYLAPHLTVAMPAALVKRVKDFFMVAKTYRDKTHIEALVNFWQLALLNPNPIARTKLFEYLAQQNITITPNGYFVTYRMVKTTDKPGVYTSNHTHKEEYIMGQAFSIPRSECDEDGSRDCSKGLHTGTPKFIGIVADKKIDWKEGETVGEGYGTGEKKVTTKAATPDSYGTGYDRPAPPSSTMQKFDNQFGNQAVICLVNPMHVVSIPDSYTRKLRACELFFVKTTTPEEVINMVEKDYLTFDAPYKQYEQEQILKMLKETHLQEYVDDAEHKKNQEKRKAALEELTRLQVAINGDRVNKSLSHADMLSLIQSRIQKKK